MTRNQLLARLIERDSNFSKFAKANEYQPRTVRMVVNRYVGTDKKPQGILTYKILTDLSKFVDEAVMTGIELGGN